MKAKKECFQTHPEKIVFTHPNHKPCAYVLEARDLTIQSPGKARCSIPDLPECTADEHKN